MVRRCGGFGSTMVKVATRWAIIALEYTLSLSYRAAEMLPPLGIAR